MNDQAQAWVGRALRVRMSGGMSGLDRLTVAAVKLGLAPAGVIPLDAAQALIDAGYTFNRAMAAS